MGEAFGPCSRKLYHFVRDSLVRFIQTTVDLDDCVLKFLDKPIHGLLLLDFEEHNAQLNIVDNNSSSSDDDEEAETIDYGEHCALIRSYLLTYCWLICIPSPFKNMFTQCSRI